MTVDQLINVLVTITLFEMMAAVGLGVVLVDLAGVARDWKLMLRAALANYICVPAITITLLLLFDPHPMVAAGFLILAVCPGAPYGPPFTAIARGNVAIAVGLMMLLAGSSAIIAPILLRCLLPILSVTDPINVDAFKIAATLFATQLLPLCIGVAVRQWRPSLADRLQKPANLVSKLLNLIAVGFILVVQFDLLSEIRLRGIFGMILLLAASWATGWLLSEPAIETRKAMAVTTSLRNASVGLVVATSMFAGTAAVTATVAFGLVSLFGTFVSAKLVDMFIPSSQMAVHISDRLDRLNT
jgi:BASS family bile acid:Na+ symporter